MAKSKTPITLTHEQLPQAYADLQQFAGSLNDLIRRYKHHLPHSFFAALDVLGQRYAEKIEAILQQGGGDES